MEGGKSLLSCTLSLSLHLPLGHFAVTDMNDHSSRSHVIFTVTVERSDLGQDGQQHVRMGKLNLVDLAVSRRSACAPPSLPPYILIPVVFPSPSLSGPGL